jgi:hypothetical protein
MQIMAHVPRDDGSVVLFHFHTAYDLCRARLSLLKRLNPGASLFGLFGGDPAACPSPRELPGLEHVDTDPAHSPAWFKKNTDLAVAGWFQRIGRDIRFNRVYVVQWDLLFFVSLAEAYPALPDDAIALTGLVRLRQIAPVWDWVTKEPLATHSRQLLEIGRQQFGYAGEPYACIGPGYSLSRVFLERFSGLNLEDETGHDELRLPMFAEILGVPICDTGFYPRWRDPAVEAVFNADAQEVDPALVASALDDANGRRVFHPCRARYDAGLIEALLARVAPNR